MENVAAFKSQDRISRQGRNANCADKDILGPLLGLILLHGPRGLGGVGLLGLVLLRGLLPLNLPFP